MSIKESIEQIRSKLTEEQVADLSIIFKRIENKGIELDSSLKAANAESKDRKLKIRQLESEKEDLDVEKKRLEQQVGEIQEKINDPTRNKELEDLRAYKKNNQQKIRIDFVNYFKSVESHPRFEDVQDKFAVPEEKDEKGNLKWDALSDEQMEKNASTLDYLNSIKYFGEADKDSPRIIKGQAPDDMSYDSIWNRMRDPDPKVREKAKMDHQKRLRDLGASEASSPFGNVEK